jgi:Ca2+-binding RTX toxin-like protein
MIHWLSQAFTRSTKPSVTASAERLRVRPQLEALESRLVPTFSQVVAYQGDIYIYGSEQGDYAVVEDYGIWTKVTVNDDIYSGGLRQVYFHNATEVFSGHIYYYGYGGDDFFQNASGLVATAYGYDGNDTLIGGWNTDYLYGLNGTDNLYGNAGNDVLDGGWDYATNYLYGGAGNDRLDGAFGADYMYGEDGNDVLHGWDGSDVLHGGTGTDWLYGDEGNDWLHGGDDGVVDYLRGGSGSDWFQQDWGWRYDSYYGFYYQTNLDSASDFNPYEDHFYNAQ